MSIYENKTAEEREALAAARKPLEEVPKCGFYFDNSDPDACDLRRSHICGPSEIAMAYAEFFASMRRS